MDDGVAWDALLGEFPEHTVFHSLPWLSALAAVRGLSPVLLRYGSAERTLAVWPCLTTRKGTLRVNGSPLPGLATPYLGPLFSRDVDPAAALEAFLRHPVLERAAYVSACVVDRRRPVDLTRFGFSVRKRFETSWIGLEATEEELWRNLKSSCRTRIRRAEKLGVEVRREEDAGFVDDMWSMTLETYHRSGSAPTHARPFLEEVWRRLHPAGRLMVLSAFHEGARVSTLVLPYDDHAIYYWSGATYDRHRHLPAGNLLHWQAIVEARRLGLRGYDMISTGGGPGRFKKTFGAEVVHAATNWERASSPIVALGKAVYERYLRLRMGVSDSQDEAGA